MEMKLSTIINEKRISIRKAAVLCNVPKSTIADICAGAIPRLDTLEQIAKGLNVHMPDLFDSPYK